MTTKQSKYHPIASASARARPRAHNNTDISKVAQVANLPVQTVAKYYAKDQIPKALVSRIKMAEVMLGGAINV